MTVLGRGLGLSVEDANKSPKVWDLIPKQITENLSETSVHNWIYETRSERELRATVELERWLCQPDVTEYRKAKLSVRSFRNSGTIT